MKALITAFAFGTLILILAACQNEKSARTLSEAEQAGYLENGKAIVATTFSTLSGKLKKAMDEGGPANAMQHCNTVAVPLVDSLSKAHNATIRRTSLKARNPANAPVTWEIEALKVYEAKVANGEELTPQVLPLTETAVAFMAPIRILPQCLNCHGEPGKDIAANDSSLLKELYPEDKATGYREGDLRGIWSVTFNKQSAH